MGNEVTQRKKAPSRKIAPKKNTSKFYSSITSLMNE